MVWHYEFAGSCAFSVEKLVNPPGMNRLESKMLQQAKGCTINIDADDMQMKSGHRWALLSMINVAAMGALQSDVTGHRISETLTWSLDRELRYHLATDI